MCCGIRQSMACSPSGWSVAASFGHLRRKHSLATCSKAHALSVVPEQTSTRRLGGRCRRGRSGDREDYGAGVRAAQAGAPPAAGAAAPRTHHLSGAVDSRLRKIGEDVTETLELIPRQWKVIQHVREKFSCRACELITQTRAPSHPIARGRAGPKLLAHVLFAKYGLHLPLNRQSEVYAREGIDLDVSTLADWVGAAAATLMPLTEAIRVHVFAAERIHADDTTVPVLAKNKTRTGRLWTYVRDDRPRCRHAQTAIVEEAGECMPALEDVIDRFAGVVVF